MLALGCETVRNINQKQASTNVQYLKVFVNPLFFLLSGAFSRKQMTV